MKIVVVSDNHGKNCLKQIINKYNDVDYFVHCGDSEQYPDELTDYISVKGNNDYYEFDDYRILNLENHRILIIHGHHYVYGFNRRLLVEKAKNLNCDVVFFGHTHMFENNIVDNVQLINPGSLKYNRDSTKPSYAEVEIKDTHIKVKKITCDF